MSISLQNTRPRFFRFFLNCACLGITSVSLLLNGCSDSNPNDASDVGATCENLTLEELSTMLVEPAGVRVIFELVDCHDASVTDLTDNQLVVSADGDELTSLGAPPPRLSNETGGTNAAALLIDLSSGVVSDGSLDAILDAAWLLSQELNNAGYSIALYPIAGPSHFTDLRSFTTNLTLIEELIGHDGSFRESEGFGSRDLHGSVIRTLEAIAAAELIGEPLYRSLIIVTAGADQSLATSFDDAKSAVDSAAGQGIRTHALAVGSEDDLSLFRQLSPAGVELAANATGLEEAARRLISELIERDRGRYLVAVCSPRIGGSRELEFTVNRDGARGSLRVSYDAEGFDLVGCDPDKVADPCGERECGWAETAGLISCGVCPEDRPYCDQQWHCTETPSCAGDDCDTHSDGDGDADSDEDEEPGEECNGLDDDGDGEADNGFDCVQGELLSCTSSCGTEGDGYCSDFCELPTAFECIPPAEICGNADDEDCDGVIDNPGGVIGDVVELVHSDSAANVSIAWNGSAYGVVWDEPRFSRRVILFAEVDIDGTVIVGPVELTSDGLDSTLPALVWNGSEYAMHWQVYLPPDSEGKYFMRFDRTGAMIGTRQHFEWCFSDSGNPTRLVWTGTEYAAVYPCSWGIEEYYRFARFDASGSMIGVSQKVMDAIGGTLRRPSVSLAWTGTEYGIVWNEGTDASSPTELYFVRFSIEGVRVDPEVLVTSGTQLLHPSLAWNGTDYGLVWASGTGSETHIHFDVLRTDGLPTLGDVLLDDATHSSFRPAITFDGVVFAVVWAGWGSSDREYGQFARIDSTGTWVTPPFVVPFERLDRDQEISLIATAAGQYAIAGGVVTPVSEPPIQFLRVGGCW